MNQNHLSGDASMPIDPRHSPSLAAGIAVCLAGIVVSASSPIRAEESPVNTAAAASADPTMLYEERSTRVADGTATVEFRYRLLRPEPGTGDGQADARYPLVIFLHGAGERGSDNAKQLKYLPTWLAEPTARRKRPTFVLAPQCRMDERWVDVSWADGKSTPHPATPTVDLAAAVQALDDVMGREAVDPTRVYLTGLSMGGFATWDLAARRPNLFAAILPVCGGGDEQTADRIAALPTWCFHGDADKAVPVRRSRDMIAAVRAAGGRPIYSEMAGVGHDSWTPAYRDEFVLDWLFSQRRK